MSTTTDLGLRKPGRNEFFNIDDLNDNLDLLNELLKERIEKTKVVNNLTTTEEGFVADARALKALADSINSINDILSNLNTNLSKQLSISDFSVPVTQLHDAFLQRKARMVNVRLTFLLASDMAAQTPIITLPETYRPQFNIKGAMCYGLGSSAVATVGIDGVVFCDGDLPGGQWVWIYFSY